MPTATGYEGPMITRSILTVPIKYGCLLTGTTVSIIPFMRTVIMDQGFLPVSACHQKVMLFGF
jgi:hypothetical protein